MTGRHRGADPTDVAHLNGEWHIGRHNLGSFPLIEMVCPCPKAPCGLAVPREDILCPQHHGLRSIHQMHHVSECAKHVRLQRKAAGGKPWMGNKFRQS